MLASERLARRLIQIGLLFGDGVGLFISLLLAMIVRFGLADFSVYTLDLLQGGRFGIIYACFVLNYYIFDLYEPRHWRSKSLYAPLKIIFASISSAFVLFAWFYFVATSTAGIYGRGVLLGGITLFTLFTLVFRFLVSQFVRRRTQVLEWLFVGGENSYQTLFRDWEKLGSGGRLIRPNEATSLEVQLRKAWGGIIVDGAPGEETTRVLMRARLAGQAVLSLQNFYEFYCGKVPVHSLDDSWFVFTEGFSIIHSQISSRLKRAADILISSFLLVGLFPLMLVLWVLIRIESRGAALYKQVRVGQGGAHFVMWKFRSMRQDAEVQGAQWAAANDQRVTRLGRLMRKTRMDELPQLWNILKGEMSFIGPRPERPEFTEQLSRKIPFFEIRHLVKPGLTGWAQVMYPYGASEEDALEKLQYDLYYIKNYSFAHDMEIILKTVSVVMFGAGR